MMNMVLIVCFAHQNFKIHKKDKEVTFTNSKKLFGKLVTKNKPLFNQIVDEQKEKYKELKLKLSKK